MGYHSRNKGADIMPETRETQILSRIDYLESRGVSRLEAEQMIVRGFLGEMFSADHQTVASAMRVIAAARTLNSRVLDELQPELIEALKQWDGDDG